MSRDQNSSVKPAPTFRKTILVVEDDHGIGNFLTLALAQETSYDVQLVKSGRDALRVAQETRPILFLLDYHLPSMTGIQLYDELHAIKGLENIPAIMVSARLPQQEIQRRQIVGLKKPFDLDDLLGAIEQVLA